MKAIYSIYSAYLIWLFPLCRCRYFCCYFLCVRVPIFLARSRFFRRRFAIIYCYDACMSHVFVLCVCFTLLFFLHFSVYFILKWSEIRGCYHIHHAYHTHRHASQCRCACVYLWLSVFCPVTISSLTELIFWTSLLSFSSFCPLSKFSSSLEQIFVHIIFISFHMWEKSRMQTHCYSFTRQRVSLCKFSRSLFHLFAPNIVFVSIQYTHTHPYFAP